MSKVKSLNELDLAGKRVLVRVDYNVPMDDDGKITDDSRIQASLPTINNLLERGAALTLMSHMGRPKGQVVEKYSLAPVAAHLGSILDREVTLLQHNDPRPGGHGIFMLENLRFNPGETNNDPAFAAQLAKHGDVYVNDAFGAAHRAHASIAGVCEHFSERGAGLLMEKELHYLSAALAEPERPFTAILGGSKISDKLRLIDNLLTKVDRLIIGGGMSYTFLAAQDFKIGNSLVEQDFIQDAKRLIEACKDKGIDLLLPLDHLTANAFKEDAETEITLDQNISDGYMGLDIGPETINLYAGAIRESKTIVWNGPMGVFEWEAFSTGTVTVAEALAACDGLTVIGGGDSVAAVNMAGVRDRMTHISTGGGASLELLGGNALPGIVSLES